MSHLAATLAGGGRASRIVSRGQALAALAGRAAACLRDSGDPELRHMADGLDTWAREGGDLQALMGLRPRRGRRDDLPANAGRRQARDAALRQAARSVAGADADTGQQLAALRTLLAAGAPAVRVLREHGDLPVPESDRQLRRILRGE